MNAWPIDISGYEGANSERVDIDHDGVLDERVTARSAGSGYSDTVVCLRLAGSGDAACEETLWTAYSMFSASHRETVPAVGNRAGPYLDAGWTCAAPDPRDPRQGAMWALQADIPMSWQVAVTPRWVAGHVADQQSVCMSLAQAEKLSGGLSWNAESPEAALALTGWTVDYHAAWPQWTLDADHNRTPHVVATLGSLVIYQLGPSLAAYDPTKDRHTWLVNFGRDESDGFKVDRWERIEDGRVTTEGAQTLVVAVSALGLGPDGGVLKLDLSALLDGAR